ncbi:hypothetical protein SAMN04488058_101282 [Deinococcus reticulitermitis]|uniref:Uncharacterized protein n=1 Tax=Deinococcus reticulitermitis TaxID=856736 RepID=A0A1H6SHU5_9DEIO|nr:hypothetical protein [Deinococcus reticulitermitis]SEI66476.1 hypothetical protein SAMN04488058_101282 [Deinococcus reticulitermitis]
MLWSPLRAALLVGAVLLFSFARADTLSVLAAPPVPAFSPPSCRVEARWTGQRSWLGQYLIEIRLPDACPREAGRLTRIITRHGGIVPPAGYFRLGAGYPRAVRQWVLSPAYVRDRAGPNDWRDVPIQGAPWLR